MRGCYCHRWRGDGVTCLRAGVGRVLCSSALRANKACMVRCPSSCLLFATVRKVAELLSSQDRQDSYVDGYRNARDELARNGCAERDWPCISVKGYSTKYVPSPAVAYGTCRFWPTTRRDVSVSLSLSLFFLASPAAKSAHTHSPSWHRMQLSQHTHSPSFLASHAAKSANALSWHCMQHISLFPGTACSQVSTYSFRL